MLRAPLDFLNLFVNSPGDIIYFIALIVLTQAALFMVLGERWRRPKERDTGRYLVSLVCVLLTWVIVMLGALYTVIEGQGINVILPPLERAANVIIILLLGWAFITADHSNWSRSSNIVLLLLSFVFIGAYILTGSQWMDIAERSSFNLTSFGVAWTFLPALLALMAGLVVIINFRLITDAPLKLLFFAILFIGYSISFVQIVQGGLIGDYTGAARLAMLAAFPFVPVILYRMVISHLQAEILQQSSIPITYTAPPVDETDFTPSTGNILPFTAAAPVVSPVQRDSIQLLKTLGLILENADPTSIPQRVVTAGLEVLKADIGALLTFEDANYADVTAAYNAVTQQPIIGMALNLENQPTLVNAVERHLQRPIFPDRNAEELRDLYNRLDIEQYGTTYFQPLMNGKELVAVFMVGLPYSGRELEETERELLKGIGIIAGSLLALSFQARDARLKAEERAIQALVQGVPMDDISDSNVLAIRNEMQASLQASRDQITQLSQQVTALKVELDHERNRVVSVMGDTEEGLSVSQRILVLNDEQQHLREERDRLAQRLEQAETALAGATASSNDAVLKTMIEVLRREKDDLLIQRDVIQNELNQLRAAVQPTSVQAILDRMIQEKSRLEIEREQLNGKLNDIGVQLRALGIETGPSGFAQLIAQLTEQRTTLQARLDTLTLERDALVNERRQFEEGIAREKERASRIQALENELRHIASDREALTRERDQIKTERDEALVNLELGKQQRARLIAETSGYQIELSEAHQEQIKLQARLQQLADENSDLKFKHDHLLAEKQAIETQHNLLLARSDGDRERIQQLGDEGVGSLTRMIEEISSQRNQLERELNEARAQLAATQNKMDVLQVRANADVPLIERNIQKYDPELFLGMVQELRTPLTSVIGYIDLLLDETAGIIGEMQRKFLQRVAANMTRMTFMLEDLTRITALDTNRLILLAATIDIVVLIEDAISNSTYEFREKGLAVNLNIDDHLPSIRADGDAVAQIIKELLTNAYLASPPGSQVFITAHRQDVQISSNGNLSTPTDCILISVEDRGGGIPPDEVPRVFARKYKAENPLVPGLGDTGVGLSIAKALAEAHGGGIWAETRPNIGSIFYCALPVKTALENVKDN
ncbi:MAG: hypothetical protein JNJ61_15135 [Anaerolineae bacterium]|nr:hypothetical protein [Anaerolineae bacterium]